VRRAAPVEVGQRGEARQRDRSIDPRNPTTELARRALTATGEELHLVGDHSGVFWYATTSNEAARETPRHQGTAVWQAGLRE
jgi:hypothetical protein